MHRTSSLLRILAVLGLVLTLGWLLDDASNLEPRQDRGLLTLFVLLVLSVVVALTLMRDGAALLRRNLDLLVPLGCLMLAWWAVDRAMEMEFLRRSFHDPWFVFELGKVVIDCSLHVILSIGLFVGYAAWVTTMMLRAVAPDETGDAADHAPLRRFLRTLAAMALGTVVLVATLAIVLGVFSFQGSPSEVVPLAVIFLGLPAVAWNFATAALLPVVLHGRERIVPALKRGLAVSWRHKRTWWAVLLAHLLLLGLIVYVDVSFDAEEVVRERKPGGGQSATTKSRHVAQHHWGVHAFWTGAYEADTRWYTVHMEVLETPPNPFFRKLFWILFSVLAVVVKLTIIARWRRAGSAPPRRYGVT
jgi:hypothetical protein